ncbi:hypothetical protein ABTZ03_17110 [Kitasatospora sp. NPDC096077]|uniref:hypothetical protein n=1 Tax=Kitasatospora sp. NPDC096077 TaxID=3155544 RepID=UPI00332601A7
MRLRAVALVVGLAVGSALAGCSGGAPAGGGPAGAAPTLHDALLTAARLPAGFELLPDVSPAPRRRAPGEPIASMPCTELTVTQLLPTHTPSLEHVSVGLKGPAADADGIDWFGEETLDRYGPGKAAAAMADLRGAVRRCPTYTTDFPDGTSEQGTLSTEDPGLPGDEGLVLRVASLFPGGTDPFVSEVAFVREGDVILTVHKVVDQKPLAGVEAVLPAAVTAYRAVHPSAG